MKISILREFVCLAKNLNFTSTAKQCYVTQSVLSKHINQLEQEIGACLFTRNQQSVRLTEAGQIFCEDIGRVLSDYDEAIMRLERKKRDVNDLLKVGYLYGAVAPYLAALYSDFTSNNPNIEIDMLSLEHNELLLDLECNRIDVALNEDLGNINHAWYQSHVIFRDYCCIMVPKNHKLAQRSSISIKDLSGETLITTTSVNSDYPSLLEHVFKASGVDADFLKLVNCYPEFVMRVESGMGIAIIPSQLMYFCTSEDMAFIPISDRLLHHNICAIWKRSHDNPKIEALIDSIDRAIPLRDYSQCLYSPGQPMALASTVNI